MILVISLDLPGCNIDCDSGRSVEVVPWKLIAHPRAAVTCSPEGQIRRRIVVAGYPDWRTAILPLIAFRPRLASGLSGRRNCVDAPRFFSCIGIICGNEAPNSAFASRSAD